jgi:2-dehydropantoate 2-reductase
MLQDLERAHPMDGRLTGIPTPALDAALAFVVQRAKVAGLYEDSIRAAEIKTRAFA